MKLSKLAALLLVAGCGGAPFVQKDVWYNHRGVVLAETTSVKAMDCSSCPESPVCKESDTAFSQVSYAGELVFKKDEFSVEFLDAYVDGVDMVGISLQKLDCSTCPAMEGECNQNKKSIAKIAESAHKIQESVHTVKNEDPWYKSVLTGLGKSVGLGGSHE